MKKIIQVLKSLAAILAILSGGCSGIMRAAEWPEIELHRGALDVKIRPALQDPYQVNDNGRLSAIDGR